ncbi:hypothetical protein D3C78_1145610 [compost metagenome]
MGVYRCESIPAMQADIALAQLPWHMLPTVRLVDNVTGMPCSEHTDVKACWSTDALYFQFVCRDHLVVSQFEQRDDPLYLQDVIEVFLDEEGEGLHYMELEISPHNVIFDAKITNDGFGKITATDLAWNFESLQTEVYASAPNQFTYYISIPASNFHSPLLPGKEFKANFYRIDEQHDGTREYQAWCPTGAINFHLSQFFGTMILI